MNMKKKILTVFDFFLKKVIQKTLACDRSKACYVIDQLRDLKTMFGLKSSLWKLWIQEKPYILKYGDTSFNVGFLGLDKHQEQ